MAGKAIVCVVKVRWGHGCEGRYQDDLASYKNIQVWRDEVFYCLVLQVVVFALTHRTLVLKEVKPIHFLCYFVRAGLLGKFSRSYYILTSLEKDNQQNTGESC